MTSSARLPERYKAIRLLGEGGSGRVWLVEDRRRPGLPLALKLLSELTPDRLDSLRLEFATLTRFHHPNLIEVHDPVFDADGGAPGFTMEFVDGTDLVHATRDGSPDEFLDRIAEALRAIAFLHDMGLIHRDLKPANLMVRHRARLGCRLVVLDFGLAMRGEEQTALASRRTAGTLPYLAPELFDRAEPDARSDLYGLGTVLYEALHGRPPFQLDGPDLGDFVQRVQTGRRARPPVPDDLPPALGDWLEELLHPDPTHRPADAAEALARLNRATGRRFESETALGRAARLGSGDPPGRSAEMERMWELLEASGGSRVIWLTGEAGSGKDRILRSLSGEAIARGWQVSTPPPGAEFSGRDGELSIEDALAGLRRQARESRFLLLLRRVETAGDRLVRALERIAHERHEAPLRVVAALRPSEVRLPALSRLLDHAERVPSLRRVELGPLNDEGLRQFAERALGRGAVSRARLRWLMEISEGDPQVAEAALVEGAWERGVGRRDAPFDARSQNSRIGQLSDQGRRLLEAVAVFGDECRLEEAGRIAGLDPEAAREASLELLAGGMVRERDDHWSPASRTRADQLLDGLDPANRRAMFRDAAQIAEGRSADRPFRLARLWSGAGEPDRAVEAALTAARQSTARNDWTLAAERFAFALKHLDRRSPRRLEVRLQHAGALRTANRTEAAARAYGAALRLTRDPVERADILSRQAMTLVLSGRMERGRTVAQQALSLAEETALPGVKARAHEAIGTALARMGGVSEARRWLQQAVTEFAALGQEQAQAHALQALGLCEANAGFDSAREHLEQAIALFGRVGARGQGLINHVALAVLCQRDGELEEARRLLQEVRLEAVRHQNLLIEAVAASTLAQNAVYQGRFGEAMAFSLEVEDQGLHLGDDRLRCAGRSARAQTLVRCGRPAEAVALLESLLTERLEGVDPVMFEYVHLGLSEARMAIAGGDAEPVGSTTSGTLERVRRLQDPDTLLWALTLEIHRRARQPGSDSIADLEQELTDYAERGASWRQPHHLARAELARSAWYLDHGEETRAEEALHRAIAHGDRAGVTAQVAEAFAGLVRLQEGRGRGDAARRARESGRVKLDEAASRIDDAPLRRGFLDRADFAPLLRPSAIAAAPLNRRLIALYDMIRRLNSEHDPESLLPSILDMALEVVGAERGLILLFDSRNGEISVRLARGLERETLEDAEAFSRKIVTQAGSGRSILAIDARDDERSRDLKSVSLHDIHSLMCVPLNDRQRVIGTVYVDNRTQGSLFSRDDLRFLEAFADHAALALENARARLRLVLENARLQEEAESHVRFGNLIGRSPAMQRVFEWIERAAATALPVLIHGESGTGKELVARAIHFNGDRRRKPFVSENCAALPETLLQSELFGHARGAFTGAEQDHAGLFEQADGGTLFLDEVGDMSPAMQVQLLRVLEDGQVRRVGDDRPRSVDVRLLAATHRDLTERVEQGLFREDLMYRLQVLVVTLPALREREGDIPLLLDHFFDRIARQRGRGRPRLEPQVLSLLQRQPWPGNVRQLENALQRLALFAEDGVITYDAVEQDPMLRALLPEETAEPESPLSLERSEQERIREALAAANGNRARAARMLGISRATIYRKIKELGL